MESIAVALSLTRSFKDPLVKLFSTLKDEIEFLLEDALPSYITNVNDKFSTSKTFLFRDEKVNFHETYFPITLRKGSNEYKIKNIESLYVNKNYTTIIGRAGSGKSMQLKYLFLKCLEQKIKIPIFIELKSMNDYDGTILKYIYEVILNDRLSNSNRILERILKSGKFYFLFDGYDELYSKKKNKITHDLEKFIDRYNKNWYVITSRPNSGIESLPRFENNFVKKLNEEEISGFIDLQCEIIKDKEIAKRIKSEISKERNNDFKHYLSSPLLLSMFLYTFRSFPQLPKKKSKFYWNVFQTLISRHDSFTKKGGWQHERTCGLQDDEIEEILKWFCYLSYMDEHYQFDSEVLATLLNTIKNKKNYAFETKKLIYDLNVNLGLLQLDGLDYQFPHRSLQEYFAAKLISEQSEPVKKKIYGIKFKFSNRHIINSNKHNFYELCNELDSLYFKEYFVLKNLKLIIKKLNGEDNIERLRKYFKFFDYKYVIDE